MNLAAGRVKDRIKAKLYEALSPVSLDVIDDLHRHAGHMHHPGGASDSRARRISPVKIVSSSLRRQRAACSDIAR